MIVPFGTVCNGVSKIIGPDGSVWMEFGGTRGSMTPHERDLEAGSPQPDTQTTMAKRHTDGMQNLNFKGSHCLYS
jgi:hypothetical protein